jgi:uncharacterized protein YkwD
MSGGIRFTLALALIVVATVAAAPTGARPHAAQTLTAKNDLESAVLGEINALRRRHGLAPLRLNARLRAAADRHSASMARRGYFSHTSADGTSFATRVARYYPRGRSGYRAIGENLLWSSPDVDAARAVAMWLNSASHRRNLLRAHWREIGLSAVHSSAGPGVFRNAPVTVVTADFGVRR